MNRIIAAALALLGTLTLAAPAAASQASDALKRQLGSGVRVAAHNETGKVRFVGTAPGRAIPRPAGLGAGASPRQVATAFLDRHAKAFGFRAGSLRATASKTAARRSAVRFQQLNAGVPVIGGEFVVTLDGDGNVLSAAGEALPETVETSPSVGTADARAAALASVAKEHDISAVRLSATQPTLAVHDPQILGGPGPEAASLVWQVEVAGPEGSAVKELVLVDAHRGHVAVSIDQIHEALSQRVCDASNTPTQIPCATPVVDDPSDPPTGSDHVDVRLAYEYAADTYNFFAGLGRDSLDDEGMELVSTVRYCDPSAPCPYANAFWNGEQMAYGQGFSAADDVVGHELAHGVTDFSAHLFYYYQSGAINESLSDVFGEFIDQTNGSGTDTAATKWQMGEDVPGFGAIRDMENPPAFNDPDRMTSPNYTADPDEVDSGGVHQNSGVNNKAAFLMTDGGSFNGETVSGLGIPKASRIYYAAQTTLLTSASDYADLAAALPQACTNLIGTAGITAADCTEVGDAVAAVEMSTTPPEAPNPEAPTCAGGLVPIDLFFDDLEDTSSGNWATSGTGWYYPQTTHPYSGWDPTYATSFKTNLWGDDPDRRSDHSITMTDGVALPAGETAYLRFNHAYGFEDTPSNAFDGGVLEYSANGGAFADAGPLLTENGYVGPISGTTVANPLGGRQAFIRESNGYISSRATLSSLDGDDVRFRFRIGSDSTVFDYGWFVDDIRIYTCDPPGDDADGDGEANGSDNCPAQANPAQADLDGDGQGDVCDADDEADRVHDADDNCPTVANPGQEDLESDGLGDVCDADDENDGVADASDNCPTTANAGQANADGDGQGDACDADDDNDGRPDASDACPTVAAATANGCPAATGGTGGTGGTVPPVVTPPTTPPAATLASARVRSCKRVGRGRRARVRCTLRGFGAVRRATVTVKKGRRTFARKTVRPSRTGVLSVKPSRTLRKGRYKVTIVLRDASGGKRTLRKTLRVR